MRHTKKTNHGRMWTALAAATLLVVVAGACSARRPASTRFDDATITAKVKTKVAADPDVNPFEIDVDTTDGVVRLSGTVETAADRAEIVRIAENTKGVVSVQNDIQLGDPTVGDVLSDAAIEAKIKTKLAADPQISPFRIDVDVVQGAVTLTGEVKDTATRSEVEKLARNTDGVKRLDSRIKIADHS